MFLPAHLPLCNLPFPHVATACEHALTHMMTSIGLTESLACIVRHMLCPILLAKCHQHNTSHPGAQRQASIRCQRFLPFHHSTISHRSWTVKMSGASGLALPEAANDLVNQK
jgi:hypothetical protein